MRIISSSILIVLALFLTGLNSYSAPANPPPPQQLQPPPPVGFPIDSNVFCLLFAAIIYGIYRVYDFNNNANQSE